MDTFPRQVATYAKAIKVTVDGPREPRSKTSKSATKSTKFIMPQHRTIRTQLLPPPTTATAAARRTTATSQRNFLEYRKDDRVIVSVPATIHSISPSFSENSMRSISSSYRASAVEDIEDNNSFITSLYSPFGGNDSVDVEYDGGSAGGGGGIGGVRGVNVESSSGGGGGGDGIGGGGNDGVGQQYEIYSSNGENSF